MPSPSGSSTYAVPELVAASARDRLHQACLLSLYFSLKSPDVCLRQSGLYPASHASRVEEGGIALGLDDLLAVLDSRRVNGVDDAAGERERYPGWQLDRVVLVGEKVGTGLGLGHDALRGRGRRGRHRRLGSRCPVGTQHCWLQHGCWPQFDASYTGWQRGDDVDALFFAPAREGPDGPAEGSPCALLLFDPTVAGELKLTVAGTAGDYLGLPGAGLLVLCTHTGLGFHFAH
ncbi:hypothetical protein PG994_004172 [Apiospora phragmitis]|uniref:Uncharacterized protein n=1 Tax=Apiospora phragmitis TaxID=2905665 RepID=A0ABR1VPU7_9PEZI